MAQRAFKDATEKDIRNAVAAKLNMAQKGKKPKMWTSGNHCFRKSPRVPAHTRDVVRNQFYFLALLGDRGMINNLSWRPRDILLGS